MEAVKTLPVASMGDSPGLVASAALTYCSATDCAVGRSKALRVDSFCAAHSRRRRGRRKQGIAQSPAAALPNWGNGCRLWQPGRCVG